MSTVLKLAINSISSKDTEATAEKIGKHLKGGEVIELISDLGGGKTVFVKGLARGAGSSDLVSSPTFTISKVYKCPNFVINHFDFYRLNNGGIVAQELAESIEDVKAVTVLEWAGVVNNVLPKSRLTINIEQISDSERSLQISYSSNLSYLFKGLK